VDVEVLLGRSILANDDVDDGSVDITGQLVLGEKRRRARAYPAALARGTRTSLVVELIVAVVVEVVVVGIESLLKSEWALTQCGSVRRDISSCFTFTQGFRRQVKEAHFTSHGVCQ